jgi:hypothetical protein
MTVDPVYAKGGTGDADPHKWILVAPVMVLRWLIVRIYLLPRPSLAIRCLLESKDD